MKPQIHAQNSVKSFGGSPEDYQDIHDFMDQSKSAHADMRHRCLLHHSFGPYIAEQVFGHTRVNSAGQTYSVRDVAERHILEDLGAIPSFSDWCQEMEFKPWMGQPQNRQIVTNLKELLRNEHTD